MATNVIQQGCRSCRFLDVPNNKAGKRVPRARHVYRCTAITEVPPLPASVVKNYKGERLPPTFFEERKSWMLPDDGQFCPSWEPVKRGAWNGKHWLGKRVRAWDSIYYGLTVYTIVDYLSGHPGRVTVSNPETGARFNLGIHQLRVVG